MSAEVGRVRVTWAGGPGGPGVTTLFVAGSGTGYAGALSAVQAFFTSLKVSVPPAITWQVLNQVDVLDTATGSLTGTYTDGTTKAPIVGTGAVTYAAGCGMSITWDPATIIGGRRLRGRTFICPLSTPAFDSGSIDSGTITNGQTAATTLISSLSSAGTPLQVWKRPKAGSGGSSFAVQSATIKDQVAALRTRRT